MGNFIKRLLDGGLSEDIHSFMERVLDEDSDKEKMINLKFEEYLEDCAEAGKNIKAIREDERKRFLKKACVWLNSVDMRMYVITDHTSSNVNRFDINKFISDFCKSMEE